MLARLRLSRGSAITIAALVVVILVIGYFSVRPRLHPRLDAGNVTRVRVFTAGALHYEWLVFDATAIADLVDMFNAGVTPALDQAPVGDAPSAGLLFILSNDNGITVSPSPVGTGEGWVEVARGQYQYRLNAPALAGYIAGLGRRETIPANLADATAKIDAFLTARGLGDIAAQAAVCTANGRDRIRANDGAPPTSPLYASHNLLTVSQEEYSPWQIDPTMQANVLVVSAEWEVELTDYGRQYLAGQPEAEGRGRLTFLLVRSGDSENWLIEDWE